MPTELEEWEMRAGQPLTAVNLRRMFLLLTQLHYSHPANFGLLEEDLKDCLWTPKAEDRKLHINLHFNYDPKDVASSLPAIYYGLGSTDFQQTVVNDHAGFNEDYSGENSICTASAPLIWAHCARTADLAANLAETTLSFFTGIRSMLMHRLQLQFFHIADLAEPHLEKVEGGQMFYRVDLKGTIIYSHAMTVLTHSHRLKKVDQSATIEADGIDLSSAT